MRQLGKSTFKFEKLTNKYETYLYLVHFIGQIGAFGPFCSDPFRGRQVGLKGTPQRKLHRSAAGDTVKLDWLAESCCIRKIHFCLGSNEVPGLLYICYTPL